MRGDHLFTARPDRFLEPVRSDTLPPRVVATVVAKNGLPHARLLARSLRESNPHVPLVALLADDVDDLFDPAAEPFHLVRLDDPDLPDLASLAFRATRRELVKALPPTLLRWLRAGGAAQALYLDADTVVEGPLDGLWSRLDDHPVVVTPYPGLTAVGPGPLAERFLDAWTAHAEAATWQPGVDDQADAGDWLAHARTLFPEACVVDEPGLNEGYWTLPGRRVELRGGQLAVDGLPLVTLHFSGFDPARPYRVSAHAPDLGLDRLGPAAILFDQYARLLTEAGYEQAQAWPYSIDHFDTGVLIPPLARLLYRRARARCADFGNPFEADRPDSFFAWLSEVVDADIGCEGWTRFWRAAYHWRPDVQRVLPDPLDAQADDFRRWTLAGGRLDFDVPDRLIVQLPALPRPAPPAPLSRPFGVNLRQVAPDSLATAALRLSLDAAGIPYALGEDERPYAFDLVYIGPAQALPPWEQPPDRPTVAVWDWPLEDFPLEWRDATLAYAEIWTPSRQGQAALCRVTPTPVYVVPHAVDGSVPNPPPPFPSREGGEGTPPFAGEGTGERFTFLALVDPDAGLERQNLHGLLRAFRHAFARGDGARLVLRFTRPLSGEERAPLEQAAGGTAVHLDDAPLSLAGLRQALALADAAVSLHRAEAAGRWLAEAMCQGRPVIAPLSGGHLDWTTPDTYLPYPCRLVPIRHADGPYRRGLVWADPDWESAANWMRWVYEHPDRAAACGALGRDWVREKLHPGRVGGIIRQRLERLYHGERDEHA